MLELRWAPYRFNAKLQFQLVRPRIRWQHKHHWPSSGWLFKCAGVAASGRVGRFQEALIVDTHTQTKKQNANVGTLRPPPLAPAHHHDDHQHHPPPPPPPEAAATAATLLATVPESPSPVAVRSAAGQRGQDLRSYKLFKDLGLRGFIKWREILTMKWTLGLCQGYIGNQYKTLPNPSFHFMFPVLFHLNIPYIWVVVKIMFPLLTTLNTRCPIIIGTQKRDHNCDNHPFEGNIPKP